jgi:pimeloyl-ACP methyl ester carboxylesterase
MFVDWGHDLFFLRCGSPARHRGFTRAFGKVREPLREWLSARTANRKLVIAGHSLGGALALVAADEIAREQLARIEAVITFGAPKVGSAEWVSQYATLSASPEEARRLGDVTWRIVNRGDIVTRLPPFWYAHCGKLVEFYNAEPVPLVPVRSGLMPTAKFGAALAPRQGDGTVAWLRYGIAAVQGTAPFAPLWLLLDALLAIAESAPAHFIRNYGPAFPKRPVRHVCAPTGLPGMRTALDYMLVPVKWLIVLAILAAVLGVAWLFYSIFPDFTLIAAAFTLLHLVISYPFADVAPRKPKLPIWIGRGGPHRS